MSLPATAPWTLAIPLIAAAALGWAASHALTRWSIHLARRYDIVAHPNHRTSHQGATPRIGGIGIAGAYLGLWFALGTWMFLTGRGESSGGGEATPGAASFPAFPPRFYWSVLLGGGGAFAMGLWDDVRPLAAKAKFLAQVVLAAIPVALGLRLPRIGLPGLEPWALPPLVGGLVAFAWVLFWMNAYNFMDGINGIAGRFGEYLALGLLLMTVGIFPTETMALACLAGACFGFLNWNHPTARTFMGDCGSQFLGYVFAVWMLYVAGAMEPVPAVFPAMIVLSLPFSWDVVHTLLRRARRGENLFEAHRSHLYQRLNQTGSDHRATLAVCEKTFLACAVLAVFLVRFSTTDNAPKQWGSLVAAGAVMGAYTIYVYRREAERRRRPAGKIPSPPPLPPPSEASSPNEEPPKTA